ncbi:MAG TPA: YqgE/AlgH family protein [Pirellulales bacterium]|jgi:putative transcriptional regulator|nr:YqgE/AlgH family protein [Pirellulales bacterium]
MSLEGHFLVASRELLDPNFARSVVLLVQHSEEGAMGLVINRPTKTTLSEAWRQVSEAACPMDGLIYLGGPCRGPLMALHGDAELGEIEVVAGLQFCADPDKIEAVIGKAEEPSRFFIGFAGWGPGQLEAEMAQDSWLTVPATPEHAFDAPHDIWLKIMRQISTSQMISALNIKHVPADPSLN